tara:strand:- start:4955 stop:5662 length:708 start_codon:yes stop_codon:yes gene_type:complete
MNIKRAIILAGGKGSRLRPYTVVLPKPLMPIGEYPILELVIRQLIKYDFSHITLCVNHQAELIKSFFGDGNRWGIKIDYSHEIEPKGTMGPLKKILDLPENFLVMNGDILTNLDFNKFYFDHVNSREIFSISSFKRKQKIDYGVLECDQNKYLKGFKEKPMYEFNVSMGIYMAAKEIIDFIPDEFFGFDSLMLKLLNLGKSINVIEFNDYWLDIGRPDDYIKAIEDFESMKNYFL